MSNELSDKPRSIWTVIICALLVTISYILLAHFSNQVASNFENPVYVTVFIILCVVFIGVSAGAYVWADSGPGNLLRGLVIAVAALLFLWAAGWVAGSNEKVAPGSPQMESKLQNTYSCPLS